ncbi:hypothetical protein FQN57_004939 [Myotisia sp. PD_48]|nr:hypothetical protein FQN57_004939 [Myotisia sp. PD_48]
MASQNPSFSSSSSEGTALPWILEHLLAHPGNYEIPLRTMYAINSSVRTECTALSPSLPCSAFSRDAQGNASPISETPSRNPNNRQGSNGSISDTAARFKANLMAQIAQLPSQPSSLPPSFITSFVRRFFPPELEEVDFPQAMTALDYLKDLEYRRRKEVMAAFERLGVTGAEDEREELSKRYPGVLAWINSIESKDRTAVALYSQVYLRIRHWALINEMLLTPFFSSNCIVMLNTLFPPHGQTPPTPHISTRRLQEERSRFYNYIRDIESKGPGILEPVIKKDMRPGDRTGWPATRSIIENYLNTATSIIDECSEVNNRQTFAECPDQTQRKGGKFDSGISFASADRPSTSSSSGSNHRSLSKQYIPPPTPQKPGSSGGSTLERIAREIRKLKSRSDLGADADPPLKESKFRPKSLRKMKSATGLRSRRSHDSDDLEKSFDQEKFNQAKMKWEAKYAKDLENSKRSSA